MKPVRVGMIRCDLHAYWFAGIFAKNDPFLYRDQRPENYWLFYGSYYEKPTELVIPTVSGLELSKVWDADRGKAETMSKVFLGTPRVCEKIEDVYEDVDLVFIADCFGEGEDHLDLAAPALEKGIPTFVDKPFARTYADAQRMVDLARESGTPLMSASLLGLSPHADRFRNRFPEIEPVSLGIVRGAIGEEGSLAGGIHVLALAQNLFGTGVDWVECMGVKPLEYVHLHYPKGAREACDVLAVTSYSNEFFPIFCGYRADVYGRTGVIHSPYIDDFAFPYSGARILELARQMVETGKPSVPYDAMLELIRIVEAGRLAQKMGGRVRLADIS